MIHGEVIRFNGDLTQATVKVTVDGEVHQLRARIVLHRTESGELDEVALRKSISMLARSHPSVRQAEVAGMVALWPVLHHVLPGGS